MIKYNYKNRAHIKTQDSYQDQYDFSINNNDAFWEEKDAKDAKDAKSVKYTN